jgi:hypothetical protein
MLGELATDTIEAFVIGGNRPFTVVCSGKSAQRSISPALTPNQQRLYTPVIGPESVGRMKPERLDRWEKIVLAVEILVIAAVGVAIWLIVFEAS